MANAHRTLGAVKIAGCALLAVTCSSLPRNADAGILLADLSQEVRQSLELRGRYNAPVPKSELIVYVDSISVHHTREEQSAIAARGADGHWQMSFVEEGPGLLKVEQRLVSSRTNTLSDAKSRELDNLLKQAALYRENSKTTDIPVVGAMFHTMEIDTPTGHTVIRWTGRLRGKAGAVADLVIGSE